MPDPLLARIGSALVMEHLIFTREVIGRGKDRKRGGFGVSPVGMGRVKAMANHVESNFISCGAIC